MLAVSRTAQRLASDYYAFLVAQLVAANPQSINSLPPAKALGEDPIGEIKRKDGTAHTLNLRHYLDLFREDHGLQRDAHCLFIGPTAKGRSGSNSRHTTLAPECPLWRILLKKSENVQ